MRTLPPPSLTSCFSPHAPSFCGPQIKLKNLIIACFIPPDYQDKIMQHCHWQDYEGAWNIDFLPYAGEGRRGGRAAVGWATCAEQPQGDDGAACSDGTLDDGVLRGRK